MEPQNSQTMDLISCHNLDSRRWKLTGNCKGPTSKIFWFRKGSMDGKKIS